MADADIETAREQRPSRFQTFSALRNVNYRYLWVSSAFISAGNQVQQIAMGWLVWDATNSTFWVGTVLGIRALPIFFKITCCCNCSSAAFAVAGDSFPDGSEAWFMAVTLAWQRVTINAIVLTRHCGPG